MHDAHYIFPLSILRPGNTHPARKPIINVHIALSVSIYRVHGMCGKTISDRVAFADDLLLSVMCEGPKHISYV